MKHIVHLCYGFFITLLLYISAVIAHENSSISCTLSFDNDEYITVLDSCVPERVPVNSITYETDTALSVQECAYLVGLPEHTVITRQMLKESLSYLKKKNKFAAVTLLFTPEPEGMNLHVKLMGSWVFHSVKFYGLIINKERFAPYYSLMPGELFDIQKHQHSLSAIKEAFEQEGYFNSIITDQIDFDKDTKMVTVHITLKPGIQFTIGAISVVLETGGLKKEEMNGLQQKLEQKLKASLYNAYYSKNRVTAELKKIKEQLNKKGFFNVKITYQVQPDLKSSKIKLIVTVCLHKKKRFVFFGNHYFSSDLLLEKIQLFGNSAPLIPPSLIAQELIDLYKKKGFWQVKIKPEEEKERTIFVIEEGPRVVITDIELKGALSFNTKILVNKFFKHILKAPLDLDILKQATDSLISFYHDQGFLDALVTGREFNALSEPANYRLVLTVQEGERCAINGVIIEGFPELQTQGPFAKYYHKTSIYTCSAAELQEQRQWILRYLQNRGYLQAALNYTIEERDGKKYIVWQVKANAPVSFGKTIFVGNSRIPFNKIARELVYKEGDVWDKSKIERSVENLRRLNVFKSISLMPERTSSSTGSQTLVLRCIEDSPFEARLRLGYLQISNSPIWREGATYKIGGSFLWKNPTNNADCLRIDGDLTRFRGFLGVQYELPWLAHYPVRTLIKGYGSFYDQPIFLGAKDTLYKATEQGILAQFTHAHYGLNVGWEWRTIKHLSVPLAQVINFEPRLINQRIPYAFIEPTVVFDYLDDKLNPTRGSLTALALKAMIPITNETSVVLKFLGEQSFFFPIYRSIIGAFRVRIGHIFNDNFNTLLPSERFYLGGPNSVRGYEPDMAPPLARYINQRGKETFVPLGGKTMFNANIELRFPIYKSFGGAVFQDIGALVTKKRFQITDNDLFTTSGFGLRYATPIGPLRFDIGIKWKKRFENDSRFGWYLTFGATF